VKDVELHEDSVEFRLVELEVNLLQNRTQEEKRRIDSAIGCQGGVVGRKTNLHGHHDLCRLVEDPLNGTVLTLAEFLFQLELGHVDLVRLTGREIDSVGVQDGFRREIQTSRRVTVARKQSRLRK
jgi:hypothetical protein